MSSNPSYQHPRSKLVLERLREPRRFLQALIGPRQVGKTTLAKQVLDRLGVPVV